MIPAVRLRGITKRYPRVVANRRVDLEVAPGEIRALMGENGAGKSTLMGVLTGLVVPDAGSIEIAGREVRRMTPRLARSLGIGMVHQHFRLVRPLTVAENVLLGREPRRRGLLDRRTAEQKVRELGQRYGLAVEPSAVVGNLPVGLQQRVEILKALSFGASILVLDEPTAVLTPRESAELLETVRRLRDDGTTVILVSHRLPEVLAVSDRITVLRRGRLVGTMERQEASGPELARMMVGRAVDLEKPVAPGAPGAALLELEGIIAPATRWGAGLQGIDLAVRGGEILGIAGVEGNGQTELAEVIAGLRRPRSGKIRLAGREITGLSVRHRLEAGLAHIPEDRLGRGLVGEMSARENAILGFHRRRPFQRRGWLSRSASMDHFRELARRFDLRPPEPGLEARRLSGGNQQKLILGRELARNPRVLLAAQPTRGLDVGAMEGVHAALLRARDRGAAVLLLSADLGEVLRLSDRVAVLFDGRIAGLLDRTEARAERVGFLMAGGSADA